MATKLVATLISGEIMETSADRPSIDHMPVDQIVELIVMSEHPGVPPVTLLVDIANGERAHRFTRHMMSPIIGENGEMVVSQISVDVYEIRKNGVAHARLYWHPVKGPILTTQDLYFSVPG